MTLYLTPYTDNLTLSYLDYKTPSPILNSSKIIPTTHCKLFAFFCLRISEENSKLFAKKTKKANKIQRSIKIKIKASIKVPSASKNNFCEISHTVRCLASQKYINIELFISTITYYNDTYNQVYDNPSFAK